VADKYAAEINKALDRWGLGRAIEAINPCRYNNE